MVKSKWISLFVVFIFSIIAGSYLKNVSVYGAVLMKEKEAQATFAANKTEAFVDELDIEKELIPPQEPQSEKILKNDELIPPRVSVYTEIVKVEVNKEKVSDKKKEGVEKKEQTNGNKDTNTVKEGTTTEETVSTVEPSKNTVLSSEEKSNTGKFLVEGDLDNILILVNKTYYLPSEYRPKDLTVPNVRFSFTGSDEKRNMRKEPAQALEELFTEAEKEGFILYAVSGFRSYSRQQAVYKGHVQSKGQAQADRVSAKPGHSEHQVGLAMDITSQSVNSSLSKKFGDTTEGKWVAENAHKYGFIIRYQKDKEHITGYIYEPWHLRYVGESDATEIFEKNITLEEYLGK